MGLKEQADTDPLPSPSRRIEQAARFLEHTPDRCIRGELLPLPEAVVEHRFMGSLKSADDRG